MTHDSKHGCRNSPGNQTKTAGSVIKWPKQPRMNSYVSDLGASYLMSRIHFGLAVLTNLLADTCVDVCEL